MSISVNYIQRVQAIYKSIAELNFNARNGNVAAKTVSRTMCDYLNRTVPILPEEMHVVDVISVIFANNEILADILVNNNNPAQYIVLLSRNAALIARAIHFPHDSFLSWDGVSCTFKCRPRDDQAPQAIYQHDNRRSQPRRTKKPYSAKNPVEVVGGIGNIMEILNAATMPKEEPAKISWADEVERAMEPKPTESPPSTNQ